MKIIQCLSLATILGILLEGCLSSKQAPEPRTLLENAVRCNDLSLLQEMATQGKDVRRATPNSWSALHSAALNGYEAMAAWLTEPGGISPDILSKSGETPLMMACMNGHASLVTRLMQRGADPEIRNKFGSTASLYACMNRHNHLLPLLYPDRPNYVLNLAYLLQWGDFSVVLRLLHDHRIHPDSLIASSEPPLVIAIQKKQWEIVDRILEMKPDLALKTKSGDSALNSALQAENLSLAEKLMSAGAPIDQVDASGACPLHYAAKLSSLPLLNKLLKNGISINALDRNHATALHWAAYYGKKEAVEFLLKNNPDLHVVSTFGNTPEETAQKAGFSDIAKLLKTASK